MQLTHIPSPIQLAMLSLPRTARSVHTIGGLLISRPAETHKHTACIDSLLWLINKPANKFVNTNSGE